VIANAPFRVTEYHNCDGEPSGIRYVSATMCLRDASRFAAALSYSRGVFCAVNSDADVYGELWLAGAVVKTTGSEVQS
jgi:hypothetical protein